MLTIDDVGRAAMALPEVTEGASYGRRAWSVRKKTFAWERPYSKADLKRFGSVEPPSQPVLAVRVDDLQEKEAVLASGITGFFTIPHFDGDAAVLIELRVAPARAVRDAIVDAWLACAPPALAEEYLASRRRRR